MVVDFTNIPLFGSSSGGVSSQIKLFESTGIIELHSSDVSGSGMLQGIENVDGTSFVAVPGRNSQTVNITNDYVAFVPDFGGFPDNCGLETTVTLDLDTFDCNNLGDNQVTATTTDTNGNSSSCIATVTVLPNDNIEFTPSETIFCEDQPIQNNLTGGLPPGGVYSGLGITDDGNGTTFSFDPSIAGEGFHVINYTTSNSCGSSTCVDAQIEVIPGIPQIECQDISVELAANGTVTIEAEDLILGNSSSSLLYALGNSSSSTNNIFLYDYDSATDDLIIDNSYLGSTQFNSNFALDYNKNNGLVYSLNGASSADSRNLYSFDLSNNSSQLIASITTVNGNSNPLALAIDNSGTFYFAFQSGEINAFDLQTQTMSPLGNVTAAGGAVGLTYDLIMIDYCIRLEHQI